MGGNQNPIRNKEFETESSEPKGVKLRMRERSLRSGVD
jgi:hypothetical protein